MKKSIRFATPLIAVALMSSVPMISLAQNQNNNSQDVSIPAGTPQQQQGFRDGLECAQLDQAAHRKPEVKTSHLYVHPPVKSGDREAYRTAFEAGYTSALKHNAPAGPASGN